MQSGGGGPLRNPGFPAGRAASTSSAASPSSSSSAVSTPHLGFDSMQQQQQQQLASRQVKWFNFVCSYCVRRIVSWVLEIEFSSFDVVLVVYVSILCVLPMLILASILSWSFMFLLLCSEI